MIKSRIAAVAIALGAMTACGGQQVKTAPQPAVEKKAEPQPQHRDDGLGICSEKGIPVSGAPCLDALRVHMCAVGCKRIQVRGDTLNGPIFFRCTTPGVRYPYSDTFIAVPAPGIVKHPSVQPWCFDGTASIVHGTISHPDMQEKKGK